MKLLVRYLKPFAGILLVCLVLLFGQAACDLSLPTLMSDMVNVGIQQGGIQTGAPEALSRQGLELLSAFASSRDAALLEEGYYTVDPGSTEAQRLEGDYPLLREENVSVRREALTEEELEALSGAYGRAGYTMLLYFQQSGEDLESAAHNLAQQAQPREEAGGASQDSSSAQSGEESQGGQPALYGSQQAADSQDSEGSNAPLQEAEEAQTESGLGIEEGLDSAGLDTLYQLIPLLAYVPQEGLDAAREQAAASDSMMGQQVGVTLTRLFYQELGLDTGAIQTGYIWGKGLQMLGVALLGVIATVLVGFFSARMAADVGRRLRHDLFAKVESFGSSEFDRFSTASLITRTTNDVQQIQMLVTMGVRMICYTPIIGIGGVIFAVQKSVSLSWLVAVAVVVFLGLIAVALAVVLPKFKILQKLIDRLNLVSRENLSGMMVVRAFGNEAYEERRFDRANRDQMETTRFVQRVMSALMPAMMFGMNLLSVLIVWIGGHAIAESTLQIGDMMAFIQYAMQIIMAFLMIAMIFIMVPRASVSAGRILEVLDAPLAIQDPAQPETIQEPKGLVEFHDVSFRYGGADSDVLEHISFTAKLGETTAFIGSTGSGKSTLVNLIPRFYDVTGGSITIDGVDVRKLSQHQLREMIGYVPQKGMLFSGTVASNLRYGREDAGEEELQEALSTAQAADFVNAMDQGVDSPIAQGGTNVSGGQRQRLSIARALTRKAPIYIFDDSFSALDFKTDAALRKALAQNTAQATVLIVAQRVSTILHAQQIIVLDQGRMVGKGTHKELLGTCPNTGRSLKASCKRRNWNEPAQTHPPGRSSPRPGNGRGKGQKFQGQLQAAAAISASLLAAGGLCNDLCRGLHGVFHRGTQGAGPGYRRACRRADAPCHRRRRGH